MSTHYQIVTVARQVQRHASPAAYRETRHRRKRSVPAHGQQALHITTWCRVRLQYKRIVHIHHGVVPELARGDSGTVRARPANVTNAKLQGITNTVTSAVGVAGAGGADGHKEQSGEDDAIHGQARGAGPQGGVATTGSFPRSLNKRPLVSTGKGAWVNSRISDDPGDVNSSGCFYW
jgi:hypothetical protein